jgi:ankyrin repeat protein
LSRVDRKKRRQQRLEMEWQAVYYKAMTGVRKIGEDANWRGGGIISVQISKIPSFGPGYVWDFRESGKGLTLYVSIADSVRIGFFKPGYHKLSEEQNFLRPLYELITGLDIKTRFVGQIGNDGTIYSVRYQSSCTEARVIWWEDGPKEWKPFIEQAIKVIDKLESKTKVFLNVGTRINARDEKGMTPLMWAVYKNENLEYIKELIDSGADVNTRDEKGWTPLMWAACQNKNLEVIRVLLEAGAGVNTRDNKGTTPLMVAAFGHKKLDLIKALLDAGADVNAQNLKGWTPLMEASSYFQANSNVIRALMNAGADVNARDEKGWTPLMWAVTTNQHPGAVTTLLDGGADGKVKNNDGKTAFDLAREEEHLIGTDIYWRLKDAQ